MGSTESIVWPPAIGMPAFAHTASPPSRMPADRFDRQLVDRHPDERQREERRAAHRVDVGDRVGRRDRAEVARIVDDRHEEVGGRDDRLPLVQPVDGRIVRRLDPDQQRFGNRGAAGLGDDLLQQRGRDLAAASAAVAELREAKRGSGRRRSSDSVGCRVGIAVLGKTKRDGCVHVQRAHSDRCRPAHVT